MTTKPSSVTFQSYESLLAYIETKTQVSIPSLPAGKSAFFVKFGQWLSQPDQPSSRILFVLPDPSSNLALPTPFEELKHSLTIATGQDQQENAIFDLMNKFGLSPEKSTQPISTLSGGERLLLSLAKAYALMPCVDGVIISSPTQWLNPSRHHLLNELIQHYTNSDKEVSLAIMDGEANPLIQTADMADCRNEEPCIKPLRWDLELTDLKITFEETTFPAYHASYSLTYTPNEACIINNSFSLQSPTLITGDNGCGKSTFGKLLSGVSPAASGKFSIKCGGSNELGRMMLQESIEQLFGKTAIEHINWVFRHEKSKQVEAIKIYDKLDAAMREVVIKSPDLQQDIIGPKSNPNTLLQGKMALIAERLTTRPPLLILDEPGWGLTTKLAVPLVYKICGIAHEQGTAVAIITHQADCYKFFVNSSIRLQQSNSGLINVTYS